jgi:hypothetical protein
VAKAGGSTVLAYFAVSVLSLAPVGFTVQRIALFCALAIATAASIAVLRRSRHVEVRPRDVSSALWCAALSAICCAIALPIESQDFWYYIAAGRLAASGGNVYTELLPASIVSSLSLPTGGMYPKITMLYGPAWVWISAILSKTTGSNAFLEFVAYKAMMLGAWAALIWIVLRAIERPDRQLRAVVLLGWLPLPMLQALVDGHNDVIMVALMATWLATPVAISALPLMFSALLKYPSTPIVAVALLDAVVRRQRKTAFVLISALAVAGIVIAIYWQDGALIAGVRAGRWSIFTPVALLTWLGEVLRLPPLVTLGLIVSLRVSLVAFTLWYGWRYLRAPSRSSMCALVTAVFLALLLGFPYIHPWYLLWILPGLALAEDEFLFDLSLPLIVLMPFVQIIPRSWADLSSGRLTLLLFGAASIWWLASSFYGLSVRKVTLRSQLSGSPVTGESG